MADFTVSTDVDTLMKSADNATIKTQLDVVSPESVMNPMIEGMGLLNAFKGSAAAYSLRDINGSNPNVVRVRRASDDAEADFTATDVAGGALTDWVNTDVVQYTSGFSAGVDGWTGARSTLLGNVDSIGGQDDNLQVTVDTSYGGHFAQYPSQGDGTFTLSADVYIPSGNANVDGVGIYVGADLEKLTSTTDSWVTITKTGLGLATEAMRVQAFSGSGYVFTGNNTDVYYVRNVTITQTLADGHVVTWYDQSGNGNDATQGTTTSQPKIVDGGVYLGEVKFDGVNDALDVASSISFNDVFLTFNRTSESGVDGIITSTTAPYTYLHHADGTFSFDGTASQSANVSVNGVYYANQSSDMAGVLNLGLNLAYVGYVATPTPLKSIGRLYNGSSIFGSFGAKEVIIYNSDQSAARTYIEYNINNAYSIY